MSYKKPKRTKIPTSKVNVPEFVGLTNPFIKKEAHVTKKEVISKLSDKVTITGDADRETADILRVLNVETGKCAKDKQKVPPIRIVKREKLYQLAS